MARRSCWKFSAAPRAATGEGAGHDARAVGPIDTTALRWDASGIDPNINHLNAAHRNLRFAPEGDCRSYLLGGMPQGYPYGGAAMERHPHVEEFFLVSGDMASHLGVMRAAAISIARRASRMATTRAAVPAVLAARRGANHDDRLDHGNLR